MRCHGRFGLRKCYGGHAQRLQTQELTARALVIMERLWLLLASRIVRRGSVRAAIARVMAVFFEHHWPMVTAPVCVAVTVVMKLRNSDRQRQVRRERSP